MCQVLDVLAAAVAQVPVLPSPKGLGAGDVLAGQVRALTAAVVVLQRELAVRSAALERQSTCPIDIRGDAVRAGLGEAQAARLRRLGAFAAEHDAVGRAWSDGSITCDQVAALRAGAAKLPDDTTRTDLLNAVLHLLPGLDAKRSRRLIEYTVDLLQPTDGDFAEQSDYAARTLDWARTPGGGIALQGYLPPAEAEAFLSAINCLAEDLRVAGDGLTPGQRSADALTALVDRARQHGLPSGGGLPAALTLTVSFSEAQRIAARNPSTFGSTFDPQPPGGATAADRPAGDAAVRFGLCCGSIAPALGDFEPGSPIHRIANTPIEPLAMGRGVRLATPAQRRALHLRDAGCAIPGCAVSAPYTQPHHVLPWAMNGKTDLDNLVSLCFVHHRQVELGRFQFIQRSPGQPQPPHALPHPLWWIIPPLPDTAG